MCRYSAPSSENEIVGENQKKHEKNGKIVRSMITYFLFSFKDPKNSIHFFIKQNSLSRLDDLLFVSWPKIASARLYIAILE